MTPNRKTRLLYALEEIKNFINSLPEEQECGTCKHYQNYLCDLCDDKPPAEIIKKGCPQWVFDENSAPF